MDTNGYAGTYGYPVQTASQPYYSHPYPVAAQPVQSYPYGPYNPQPYINAPKEEVEQVSTPPIKLQGDPGVLNNFILYTGEFLRKVSMAFDDCPLIAAKLDDFEKLVVPYKPIQEKFCKEYHKQMEPLYDACRNKNPAPFLEGQIKFLVDIRFKEKYEELTDPETYTQEQIKENTDNLWEYLSEMNKYSGLFNQLPSRMVAKIENVALDIAKKISSGEKDYGDLDIFKIGQDIVGGATGEEIGTMMTNMPAIWNAVGGEKGMNEMKGAGAKMPNIGNFSSLLSMAQKGFVPGSTVPFNVSTPPVDSQSGANQTSTTTSTPQKKGWKAKPME